MPRLPRLLSLAVVVPILLGLLVPFGRLPSSSAVAGTRLGGIVDLVVDDDHARVFVSQGDAGVAVFSTTGSRLGTIPGLARTGPLLMGGAGRLWVGLPEVRSVAEVDPLTLETVRILATPDACARGFAETAGLLWFTSSCGRGVSIAALDPDDGSVRDAGLGTFQSATLATSPARPDTLYVGGRADDADRLSVYRVATTPDVDLTRIGFTWDFGATAFELSPDGTRLVDAYGRWAYTAKLSRYRRLSTSFGGRGVSIRSDGMVALASDDGLAVYADGANRSYDFRPERRVQRESLAWSAAGLQYVALESGVPVLRRWIPQAKSKVAIRLDRARYPAGDVGRVTVQLETPGENRTVTVVARPEGEASRTVLHRRVGASGSLSVRVRIDRPTTFVATYAGDTYTRAATAERTVSVRTVTVLSPRRPIGRAGGTYLFRAGRAATFAYRVRPVFRNTRVATELLLRVHGRWEGIGGTNRLRTRDGRLVVTVPGERALVGRLLAVRGFVSHDGASVEGQITRPLRFRFVR